MATFNEGILSASTPEKCGCQELLNKSMHLNGWLRRRCRRNALQIKYIKWPQQYVILGGKCLYYFSSETSKSPEGAVSLYGFNRVVRASDIKSAEAPWAFKLEHIQPHVRTMYFAAGSEREMLMWMKAVKAEMLSANNLESKFTKQDFSSESSSNSSWDSGDYRDLEESIYMEPVGSRISKSFHDQDRVHDTEDDEDNEDNEDFEHPPLPPRPANVLCSDSVRSKTLPHRHAVDGVTKASFSTHSLKKNVFLENKESSHKEPTLEQQTLDHSSTAGNDSDAYWKSVYFHGSKSEASGIMVKCADDGVYLVRKSDDNSNVLLVYAHPVTKKYRILEKDGQFSLTRDGPNFQKIEDLLYHYYSNDLPSVNVKLVTPYKLHNKYH